MAGPVIISLSRGLFTGSALCYRQAECSYLWSPFTSSCL